MEHPWIEDFEQFEAVLVCTNELPVWGEVATLRAFQTYQWSGAPTQEEDSSFSHNETGVVVRHDGNIVAIDCGQGVLADALPDLFLALSALGWVGADVYHPIATLNELLADMGRAIPASSNFDVRPAQMGKPISEYAEGQSLMAHARRLTGQDVSPNAAVGVPEDIVLNELRAMNESLVVGDGALTRATAPIVLVDEEEEEDSVMVNVARGEQPLVEVAAKVVSPNYDEEPAVFRMPGAGDAVGSSSPALPSLAVVDDEAEAVGGVGEGVPADSGTPLGEKSVVDASVAESEEKWMAQFNTQAEINKRRLETVAGEQNDLRGGAEGQGLPREARGGLDEAKSAPSKTLVLGHSVFCFDVPGDPLSDDDMGESLVNYGIAEGKVVHVYPGAVGEAVRWDVLGEIDRDYPWFAERLAAMMLMPSSDTSFLAVALLAQKNSKPFAGLRDVLTVGMNRAARSSLLDSLLLGEDDFVQEGSAAAIVRLLGGLMLVPVGKAFVDLLDGSSELDPSVQESFVLREVMQSPVPRMFVVHVDALDGPFVEWIVGLLHAVATIYSKSKRSAPMVEAEPIIVDNSAAEAKAQAEVEIKNALSAVMAMALKLGIDMPAASA